MNIVYKIADNSQLEAIDMLENSLFDIEKYDNISKTRIKNLLNKKSAKFFVALSDQEAVGYALALIVKNRFVWFYSLAVKKEFQQYGIAKELFSLVENLAQESREKKVVLEIRSDNRALERRYKNIGYCLFREDANFYPDGCSALRMLKTF